MHISRFAHQLKCTHCEEFHGTDKWPVDGDMVPFYHQNKSGNFSLKVTCPHCGSDWYVVWDNNPGPIQPLDAVRERKMIHTPAAIKREIEFTESGEASEFCCWNCRNFSILVGGKYWCVEHMSEVDRRDWCQYWSGR